MNWPITVSQTDDGTTDSMLTNSGIAMSTTVTLYADGRMDGVTETIDHTEAWGGHGAVIVLAFDANGQRIWASSAQRYGVDPRANPFGTSDRTDNWTAQLDPDTMSQLRYLAIKHYSAPNNALIDIENWLGGVRTILDDVVGIVQDLVKLFGSTASQGASSAGTTQQGLSSGPSGVPFRVGPLAVNPEVGADFGRGANAAAHAGGRVLRP